jgi:hypothetical protein
MLKVFALHNEAEHQTLPVKPTAALNLESSTKRPDSSAPLGTKQR